MGDNGQVVSIRVTSDLMQKLDRVVEMERTHARPGHRVARVNLIILAVEHYVRSRLRDKKLPATTK
jgi:hypothetical protein